MGELLGNGGEQQFRLRGYYGFDSRYIKFIVLINLFILIWSLAVM